MKRRVKSALGKYLVPSIHKFLLDNAKTVENNDNVTVEIPMADLANAIEFGWAKAMSSSIMQGAFALGISPPPVAPSTVTVGGPIGVMIYNGLKPQCTE